MATRVVITKEQLDGYHPCSSHFYENSPRWDGYALIYEDMEAEIARLAAIKGGIALLWLAQSGLIPDFRVADAVAAIKRAFPDTGRVPVKSQKPK
jgi:hypothetical protein